MLRTIAALGLLALSGCGYVQMKERQAQEEAIWQGVNAAVAACPPLAKGEAIRRAVCLNAAEAPSRVLMGNDTDLFDLRAASRLAIAEKQDRGVITIAQANLEFSEVMSRVQTESQRRQGVNRAVAAQEAAARPRSTTCMSLTPGWVTCN